MASTTTITNRAFGLLIVTVWPPVRDLLTSQSSCRQAELALETDS